MQTSIAVGAGMAQYGGSIEPTGPPQYPKHHQMHSEAQHPTHPASPHVGAMENRVAPHLSAIPEPEDPDADSKEDGDVQPDDQAKPQLRVDPFLGEWLSPEYFEMITSPPDSLMMLAGAKAELMRDGEYVDVPAGTYRNGTGKGNFPGGWGSSIKPSAEAPDGGPLSSISSIGGSLPRLNRASSHSSVKNSNSGGGNRAGQKSVSKIEVPSNPQRAGYEPPTPSYSISSSDPIPPGYVAHAKDACIDVDIRWDSMRPPHDWGNGGNYGEEWSAMHKRFRRGLQSMLSWYQHSNAQAFKSRDSINEESDEVATSTQEEDDTESVLILVTHGAGCNALISALTGQPVLMDVGMASLTMAVRKDQPPQNVDPPGSPTRSARRRSLMDPGYADHYEVKMLASTDHLRGGSRSSISSALHLSPSLSSSPFSTHRHRTSSVASTASSASFSDGEFKFETENRAATSKDIGGGSALSRSASAAAGLWTKPAARNIDGASDRTHNFKASPLPLTHSPLAKQMAADDKIETTKTTEPKDIPDAKTHGAPRHPITQHGLWGAPPSMTATEREKGFKRRWTHSEHQ